MAGGTGRPGSGGKPRAAAPSPRPALGDDPFARGAPGPSPTETSASSSESSTRDVAPSSRVVQAAAAASARLDGVERRLDSALRGVEGRVEELAARAGISALEGELRETLAQLVPALQRRLGTLADLVRLLEPAERLDRFGMDPRFAQRLTPIVEFFYSTWWRVQVRGVDAVPSSGPAIVAANHAGVIPWDAFVLRHALRREHSAHRDLRPLLDDRECAIPIFGTAALRAGAVRASPESAERLLSAGGVVGVFPEGSAGARKPWRDRYTLLRFGRGGLVKVALRARAPIVPCAIVGSEEASPGISRRGWLAERLGVPVLATNPALQLAPAALLPLPSRWTLRFGEPMTVAEHDRTDADDPAVVNELTERVRATVQSMLDEDVSARTSVFL